MFDVEVLEGGEAVIELNLTITAPTLDDAHVVMRTIRELAVAGSRTVEQGDFITTISVPEPSDMETYERLMNPEGPDGPHHP